MEFYNVKDSHKLLLTINKYKADFFFLFYKKRKKKNNILFLGNQSQKTMKIHIMHTTRME